MLVVDGVYTFEDERPCFHCGSAPAQTEFQRLLRTIATHAPSGSHPRRQRGSFERLCRYIARKQPLERLEPVLARGRHIFHGVS